MKKRTGKDLRCSHVARPQSHVAHPCMHHQEATRHQSTSSLPMKVNELHLARPPLTIEGNWRVLNGALHGGLIRRRIAYPAQKISFAHPPSPGSFHDQIFICFSILCLHGVLECLWSHVWRCWNTMSSLSLTLPLRTIRQSRVSGWGWTPWSLAGPRTDLSPANRNGTIVSSG